MSKLHEIIALATARKKESASEFDEIKQRVRKPSLFQGISRTYAPLREDDKEQLPPETQILQLQVSDVLGQARNTLSDLFSLTLTQDDGNQAANADVVINGQVILQNVPVTSLLYLERQLSELKTFYESLPTLDPARNWTQDVNGVYRVESHKLREVKDKEPLTLAPATENHPAQVILVDKARTTGTWTTVDTSGAISQKTKQELLTRLRQLRDAVLTAREKANQTDVVRRKDGDAIFAYLHGG